MFSNVFKAVLFCTVLQIIGALNAAAQNDFDKLRSHRVVTRGVGAESATKDASIIRRQGWGASGSARASASASASVNAQVMLQSWSSLTVAADKCRDVFQQVASLEVAFQAAVTFSRQASYVSRRAGQCSCDPSATDVSAQYQASIVDMLSSLQVVLQLGAQQYGAVWDSRFKPVFQSFSPTFASMKQISASLRIDLAATLQQAHLDLGVFLGIGLNINALLGLNLRIGGLLSL